MTVALIGVGADTTNSSPTPPVYPDGRFEYIPIPESRGPEGTTESSTFGSIGLRCTDGTLADYLHSIQPREKDGPTYTGEQLANWPLHHDPNFDALTYGETTGRGAYTKRLRKLDDGDLVAFYTGLKGETDRYRNRYIIGYFTVAEVADFKRLDVDGQQQNFSSFSADDQESIMGRFAENAHAKRFAATGEITDNDGIVIVDGKQPGGLLDNAFRISEHGGGGHHYLTDELEEVFEPDPGGNPDKNAHLGGIKPAHLLNIEPDDFIDIVD